MGFPNFKHKHNKESIFTPRDYLSYIKRMGKYPSIRPPEGIILCYNRRLLNHILRNNKTKEVKNFLDGEFFLLNKTKNRIGIIGNFGIGAPLAATLIEELIAFGVKKFISIGEAGSLQRNVKIGGIVVCDKAIRDEGTSYHYLKPSKYAHASKKMVANIGRALEEMGKQYIIGTSWTIDAPYRETIAEAKHYQKEGVAIVEMEASALFSVAKFRKAEIGVICVVSDSIVGVWDPKYHHLSEKEWEILFQAAKNTILNY